VSAAASWKVEDLLTVIWMYCGLMVVMLPVPVTRSSIVSSLLSADQSNVTQ
jgi:hypothetical protein